MINRKFVTSALLCSLILGGLTIPASARQIGEFSNFTVTYSGSEKYTGFLKKETTSTKAVINLSNDTGTAWITAQVRNSDGASRGVVNVQRGKRQEFETTAKNGYIYRLGLKKTNNTGGGSVTIKGSWSPDLLPNFI